MTDLAKLKITCYECMDAEEPLMKFQGDDGEGIYRYDCPFCGVAILIEEGGT